MESIINFITDSWNQGYYWGMTLTALTAWYIHKKQKKAWQAEYRRLMGGIADAMIALKKPGVRNSKAYGFLDRAYNGDK